MRLPVSRLMMCRRTRLDVLVAVYIATAHETSESLRYPFQMGRGAMMRLGRVGRDIGSNGTRPHPLEFPRPAPDQGVSRNDGAGKVKPDLRFVFLMCKAR